MKLRYFFLSLFSPFLLHAGENQQNAGLTQFFLRTSSSFNTYTNNPSTSTETWIYTHIWRLQSSSPYFDTRLSWMPNAWAYLDLYGIPISSQLVSQHPEWILHDSIGNRLYIPFGCSNGTCPNYAGDVTNSNFRNWWIARAQSILLQGYKGFWIDDVNLAFRVGDGSGTFVAPYDPNTGTTMTYDNWRLYMAQFTEQIRAALPTAEIVHNAIWFAAPTRYSDQYVIREIQAADYINCERGVSDPGLGGGTGSWSVRAFLAYVDAVHSYGKNVVFDEYVYNGDYGLAGYYLISNGGDALGNQQVTPNNWWSGYEVNLGTPLGPRYDWNTLIRRDFMAGMVLLNPPRTTAITVTLPVPLTKIDDGSTVTTVTLNPGQAVVLTGAMPIPDYSLTAAPSAQTVTAGSTATYTATVAPVNGFIGSVALTASGLPSGANASFNPASISGSGSSSLSITTTVSTPVGTYPVTIAATSGSLRHTATVSLNVNRVPVNLSSVFNRAGVYTDGSTFTSGGLDGYGFAYSRNLLGSTQTFSGIPYTFGAANVPNAVTSRTIPLPAGQFSALNLVGTAVNGNQTSQQFTINYSDGTVVSFVQNMSNWKTPANYTGETAALAMPYRDRYTGLPDNRTFYIYSYSFITDKTKTIRSVSLPGNSNVLILAATLTP
jgi:hypothetical protein